ncbi:phosphate/phosphite/phosphonate ABC transporter substrate-binding protein [Enterobacter oligotrophicus]|uniref:phosphate/phosphite/phosphonate ABC transporter substrate-binding protein n=1 Tax=Enterobacter oligotrophicus TaxID=2478464 RepID=UPI0023F05A5F|nr:PhnD/SsuA/transferrin family substrate-binding protein [Enterobacter oligotrophicus]
MSNLLAFPMYAVDRANTDALWRAVQTLLAARGVAVGAAAPGVPDAELLEHWRDPRLILSQACGYPLVTQLPDVQVVGCFHYSAPGCEGEQYRSFLVVREEDKHHQLADFRGRRAVCNSLDSQSGYNALLKKVAPLAVNGRFFSQMNVSGSHRQSLRAVRRGEGDIAAIDCVTYALLQRHEPQLSEGLAVIDCTSLTPGLPLITSRATSADTLHALRDALNALVKAPEYRGVCDAVLIKGFREMTRQPYARLLAPY